MVTCSLTSKTKANSWVKGINNQVSKLHQLLGERKNRCQTRSILKTFKVQTKFTETHNHKQLKRQVSKFRFSQTTVEVVHKTGSKYRWLTLKEQQWV